MVQQCQYLISSKHQFQCLVLLFFIHKANTKDVVNNLCDEAFRYRNHVKYPKEAVTIGTEGLSISQTESEKLLEVLSDLIKEALFITSTDPKDVISLFPDDFHKNLRDLLAKLLIEKIPSWKSEALNNLVSLPRLVDMNWRVDVKMASDNLTRMSVPTCILQLKVQENSEIIGKEPDQSTVNVELSKETLDTMLDGLGKIRDQLASVAKKT